MNEGGSLRSPQATRWSASPGSKRWRKKVKQLEQMLGRKTMEAEILRDALR